MDLKPALVTALLATALLAGCASDDNAKTEDVPVVPDDPVSQALAGSVVAQPESQDDNATLSLDTPFLLSATTGPDAPLTAFKYRIPKGGVVTYNPVPEIPEFSFEEVYFEMVPVFTDNITLDQFAILFVDLSGKESTIIGEYVGFPEEGTWTSLLVQENDLSYTPVLESDFVSLYAGELEDGDELGIILMGQSEKAGSFGLLMSPMDKAPKRDADPAKDTAELLDGRSAVTLTPSGTGKGFQYGMYLNENLVFATAVEHIEVTSGPVEVTDQTRTPTEPLATGRQAAIRNSFDAGGHSEATMDMLITYILTPTCTAAGTFEIAMDLHGTTVDFHNLIVEAPEASVASLVTGIPIAFAVGDGAGSATSSLTFEMASATCSLEFIVAEQLDLGATLEELLGKPAATGGAAFNGLVGNVPPSHAWSEDGDLMLLHLGKLTRVQGAGDVLEHGNA